MIKGFQFMQQYHVCLQCCHLYTCLKHYFEISEKAVVFGVRPLPSMNVKHSRLIHVSISM